MATIDVDALLLKVKPSLDKARTISDSIESAIAKIQGSFLMKMAEDLPALGAAINVVITAAAILDEVVDALDGIVDANADPAGTAAATVLPQAVVEGK